MYHFVHSDNFYNFATTIVQTAQAKGIVIPNSVGFVSRWFSEMVIGCQPDTEGIIPKDLSDYGDVDPSSCDTWCMELWECTMLIVSLLQLLQAFVMNFNVWDFNLCQNGPDLANSAVGRPKLALGEWENQDQVLVNVSYILSLFFVINVLVEYLSTPCDCRGFREYVADGSKLQNVIIAVQSICMQMNAPVPTALGRIVRPMLVWGGCAKKKIPKGYREVELEMKTQIAALEGEGPRQAGCCTRDPLSNWTC